MDGDDTSKTRRTLAMVESDLLKSEEAFSEADTRLKQAERNRRAALDAINRYQGEIDEAIAALRQRSVAGSNWSRTTRKAEDALILQSEDIAEVESNSSEPNLASVSAADSVASHIEQLKTYARARDGDSLIKVVSRNRGPSGFTPSR